MLCSKASIQCVSTFILHAAYFVICRFKMLTTLAFLISVPVAVLDWNTTGIWVLPYKPVFIPFEDHVSRFNALKQSTSHMTSFSGSQYQTREATFYTPDGTSATLYEKAPYTWQEWAWETILPPPYTYYGEHLTTQTARNRKAFQKPVHLAPTIDKKLIPSTSN